jgi:hypothetical protein
MYYGFQGLGETYPVRLPVVGQTTLEVPVSDMTNDALEAATASLPQYLPTYYQQLLPYINEQKGLLMRDVEYLAPIVVDKVLDEEVLPEVERLKEYALAHVENIRDQAILALLAMTGTIVIAVGTAAWWINYRETLRDKGSRT